MYDELCMFESNMKLNTSEIHLNFKTCYYRYDKSVDKIIQAKIKNIN